MSNTAIFEIDFWPMLLLFGALQGFFLSAILFFHGRTRARANIILACLLLAISLHLTEYVALASGLHNRFPHLISLTVPMIFIIGPGYYLYTRALLSTPPAGAGRVWLHLLPASACYLYFLPFYLRSGAEKVDAVAEILQAGYVSFPLGLFVLMALSSVQMLVYFYLTFVILERYEAAFKARASSTAILQIVWLKRMSLGFSIYMFLFFVAYFQLFFLRGHRQELSIVVLLLLAVMIFAVAYHAIRYPTLLADSEQRDGRKYEKTALPPARLQKIRDRLLEYMASEKPYLQPELKLSEVAQALDVAPNHLSQAINAEIGQNFFDFINHYRVEEARQRLCSDQYKQYTILAIALDVGFSNKASFNRVFKKQTGQTPTAFIKSKKK